MRNKILSLLVLLLTAATGAWADPNIKAPVISGDTQFFESVTVTMSCTSQDADIYYTLDGSDPRGDHPAQIEYENAFTLTETTTIKAASFDGMDWSAIVEVTFTKVQGPEVTYNDAKTTASFEMPAYDATVSYELVRDMSVSMPVTVGDGKDGYRIRLKKSEQNPGKYVPAETDVAGMMALIKVHDAIENEDLTFFNMGGAVDCSVNIYAIDAEDKPVGDPIAFPNLVPGRYIAKAVAATGSAYEGETTLSNIFVLFQGYEVTVDAGEYATFYVGEAVATEDENAELYTIGSVTDTEAVLSDKIGVAPAYTPLLIYNNGDEEKTFILIPTEENADEVTTAKEFRGTLEELEMPASSPQIDYYVCTGSAFMWVRDAGAIGANKCWLQIGEQPAASRAKTRSIVGGGNTTGINAVDNEQLTDDSYFDLQGRKVAQPTRGGIYIHNGKKVIKH